MRAQRITPTLISSGFAFAPHSSNPVLAALETRKLKMQPTELIVKFLENNAPDYRFRPAESIEKAGTR
jgi:hypothetical protein